MLYQISTCQYANNGSNLQGDGTIGGRLTRCMHLVDQRMNAHHGCCDQSPPSSVNSQAAAIGDLHGRCCRLRIANPIL